MTQKLFLRRHEAAAYLTDTIGLPTARNSLNRMASQGGGPTFHRAGRIPLYSVDDLNEWAADKISAKKYRSTSEVRHG